MNFQHHYPSVVSHDPFRSHSIILIW